MLSTPRSSVPPIDASAHPAAWKKPSLGAALLGYSAFAERNQPRYDSYAQARLVRKADVTVVVRATLSFALKRWEWLLIQPRLAAVVWAELRCQVSRQADEAEPQDVTGAAALYSSLPVTSADSALLCWRVGLTSGEAAELMGLEQPAVEAALRVARRIHPHLATRGAL
ncbi:hypothetical protein ACIBCP_16300 [Streptomyces sp. NPDC051287]|uniref:hypothetical protein n=1 Tax=Streptomyces sp. NPDC051287 TaxID=3365648 RepID=UPI0037A39984